MQDAISAEQNRKQFDDMLRRHEEERRQEAALVNVTIDDYYAAHAVMRQEAIRVRESATRELYEASFIGVFHPLDPDQEAFLGHLRSLCPLLGRKYETAMKMGSLFVPVTSVPGKACFEDKSKLMTINVGSFPSLSERPGAFNDGVLGVYMRGLYAEFENSNVFSIVVDLLPPMATYPAPHKEDE